MKYLVKDLIDAAMEGEIDVIAHQANCFHTMNNGVAKVIRKNFPEAFVADCATAKGDKQKLGTNSFGWHRGDEFNPDRRLLIVNMYSQYNYGYGDKSYTNYEAMKTCLSQLAEDLLSFNGKGCKIGMPKIGAGLGGGDWSKIEKIIKATLRRFNVTIYVLDEKEIPDNG